MNFKRFSAIAMTALMCFLLASCANSENKSTSGSNSGSTMGSFAEVKTDESGNTEPLYENVDITAADGSVIATQKRTIVRHNTTTAKSTLKTNSVTQKTTVKTSSTDSSGEKITYVSLSTDKYRIYSLLSSTQKQAYNKIRDAASALETSVDLSGCSQTDIRIAYTSVSYDNPQLVWYPKSYSVSTSGSKATMKLSYNYTKSQCEQMTKELDAAVNTAFSTIKGSSDQYTTELRLHDYLASKVTYAATSQLSYTAYGALIQGKAVCEGYSRAMQLLLYRAGIECSLVTGESKGEGHMWNIVKIGGAWYHLDVTWNDSSNKGYHSYFNLSDAMILADHDIDGSIKTSASSVPQEFNVDLPSCNSIAANYFYKNGTLINSKQDFEDKAIKYFSSHTIKAGTVIEFSFSDKYDRKYSPSMTDVSDFIKKYNSSVSKDKRIPTSYSLGGPVDSKAFMVTFK